MGTHIITATEFKAKCLSLLDEVAATGGTITVTKRGKPVATLGPAPTRKRRSSRGILEGENTYSRRPAHGGYVRSLYLSQREREFRALRPRLLLDTHVLIYWLTDPKRLSRDQDRIIGESVRRGELLALCAISLMELAVIPAARLRCPVQEIFDALEPGSDFQIVPLDLAVGSEVAAMGDSLRDPADRVIVATARVHGLRLVTSDQRIIDSKLVPVVE